MNNKEISIKECVRVLTLFFILSLISVVMIYSKFEQGVEDFWKNKKDSENIASDSLFYDIIDLDSVETSGGVCEIEENSLEKSYIESNGEVNVFMELFEKYH